jgi:putative sigma-54 modulation protein
MNVYITGRQLKITPDVRRHIEKNMKKLDHYIDYIYDFKLILTRQRHIITAEVNINVKKKIIHIFARTEDIFHVLDILFDKIDVKLRRYREKLMTRRTLPSRESSVIEGTTGSPLQQVKETV